MHKITCNNCPHLTNALDGNPNSYFCSHPRRVWQDICRYDGYPLTEDGKPLFDFSQRCWSECPFLRSNTPLYRQYLLNNRVVILAHSHPQFAAYNKLSLTFHDTHLPPMLSKGILLGGPFATKAFEHIT